MYARQKKLLAHPLETAEESQLYITKSSPNTDIIFLECMICCHLPMKNNQVQVSTYNCVSCKSVLQIIFLDDIKIEINLRSLMLTWKAVLHTVYLISLPKCKC